MAVSTQHQVEMQVGGRPLAFETGLLARQADGAVVVRYGDTMVLVTATAAAQPREGIDFFPLTCDYEERMYAAGKIPGGVFKREGRPGEPAVLTARLMDRPIRPLFPKGFRNDVQVIATVLSTDQENDPAILAVNGASAALTVAGLPFEGPIGAVRVGLIGDQFVVNPTLRQTEEESRLDLVVAGAAGAALPGGAWSGRGPLTRSSWSRPGRRRSRRSRCWRPSTWPTPRSAASWRFSTAWWRWGGRPRGRRSRGPPP